MTYTYPEVLSELHTHEPDTWKFAYDKFSPELAELKSKREQLWIRYYKVHKDHSASMRNKIQKLTQQINKLR